MRQVRIVEAILRCWNPIGAPFRMRMPDDEYDSYALPIVSMVVAGCTVDELAQHMGQIVTDSIGMGSVPEKELRFAREIITALRP